MRPLATVLGVVLAAACSTAEPPPLGDLDRPVDPEHPIGWRGDGSGSFTGADIVTHWSEAQVERHKEFEKVPESERQPLVIRWTEPDGTRREHLVPQPKLDQRPIFLSRNHENIVWKTSLPWSHATPVVVGKRVFVTAEPNELVCLDAENGTILWRQVCDNFELMPPAKAQAGRKLLELDQQVSARSIVWWAATKELLADLHKVGITTQTDGNGSRPILPDDGEQRLAQHPELQKRWQALMQEAAEWNFFFGTRKSRAGRLAGAAWRGQGRPDTEALARHHETRWRLLADEYGTYIDVDTLNAGNAMTAPVSDGKQVYVRFSDNGVWCFDLEGKRRWAVWDHDPRARSYLRGYFDFIAAILYSDRLIITSGGLGGDAGRMRAYNTAGGAKLWEIDWRLSRWRCGTPIVVELEHMPVLVHTDGKVVRVSDGKILASDLPACNAGASPIANSDIRGLVYLQDGAEGGRGAPKELAAVQITSTSPDAITWKEVWRKEAHTHVAAPVYAKGKVYKATAGTVTVFDARTGETVASWQGSRVTGGYEGVTIAGDKLLVSGDTRIGVFALEPELKLLATNCLWRDFHLRGLTFPDDPVHPRDYGGYEKALTWWGYTIPHPAGNRLFMRSRDAVYCIGDPQVPMR